MRYRRIGNIFKRNFFIKNIFVNGGPVLKRFRARAFGRAAEIKKRTSHITIVLSEKIPGLKTEDKTKKITEKKILPKVKEKENIQREKFARLKKEKAKKGIKGLGNKIFRRKSI